MLRNLCLTGLLLAGLVVGAAAQTPPAQADVRSAQDYLEKAVFKAPLAGIVTELNVKEGESAITGTMNVPGTVLLTVADLSEMELDELQNQYETVQQGERQQTSEETDALMEKLKELAQRQQQEMERQRRRNETQRGSSGGTGGDSQRALADEAEPDLIVSMATLTGAARVAVGPDFAPFYATADADASAIEAAAAEVRDPVWRMPFWEPYEAMIEPGIADLDNAPKGGFAGSITAALFLRRFVTETTRYIHFDIFGWTPSAEPGRPKGGAGQGIRALFEALPGMLGS